MTLVILAAGMGSRFGGVKQLTPLTDNGEFVIDFTVYDAARAGFDRVIFIIRREHREIFDETIGKRAATYGIKVEYAYQDPELPEGYTFPEGRKKPWGTSHAIMSVGEIEDNFGVVNADDFYGFEAFEALAGFLKTAKDTDKYHYCIVGYRLGNTLSENGTVSRGICSQENGYLTSIEEKTKIAPSGNEAVNTESDGSLTHIPLESTVSMNCFGFTPSFIRELGGLYIEFLEENKNDLSKCEFLLPESVKRLLKRGKCDVKVLSANAKWMGVTYRADSDTFSEFIKEKRRIGEYPEKLSKVK